MAKIADSYSFNSKELVTLMLKEAGIHEGIWILAVNFRLGAGAFGPTTELVAPTGFVSVEGLGLQRYVRPENDLDGNLPPLAFDAAELNPLN